MDYQEEEAEPGALRDQTRGRRRGRRRLRPLKQRQDRRRLRSV